MHFAKVSLLVLAIFSCVVADEEGNNGPRTGAVSSRSRVPYANFRNGIPTVFHESAASNEVSNEATEISGYLNSGTGRNDIPQPYSFDYKATDEEENVHYHQEQADASGTVRGSYGYTDVQGLYRVVDYIADASGFRASIRTNEPGTDGKESPADVQMTAEPPPFGIQDRYSPFGGTGGPRGSYGGSRGGFRGVSGSYGYTDIDGLYRTVSYVADSSGFHVFIITNEPGVDKKESPADVNLIAREPPADTQEKYNEFRGTGVGESVTKFNYVVSHLPPEVASLVRDILMNPDATDPYTHLKTELINRSGESSQQEIRQLLSGEELGTRKPSEFVNF
ncbi:hypothetical protein AVEN_14911-1 [Araneus ventricosus]|uniref:DUF7041 domain-containing protein n=1 Tax=Araneus ventricosus TaxID=182803 RepID=A0A4Y2JPG7_ARAVE|nr:hypothetical protein AVEN_14911-1 [Araneus ventricosus]